MLASNHFCSVKISQFSYEPVEKGMEISSGSKYALQPTIRYDFYDKEVKLSFYRNSGFAFEISSLDVVYDFGNYKLQKDEIQCIDESKVYKFSTSEIPRHVFYPAFTCKVNYTTKTKTCKMEIKFDIPYFQTSTEIAISKLDGYEIPEEIYDFISNENELLKYVNSRARDREGKLIYALYIEDVTSQDELKYNKLLNIMISYVRFDYEKGIKYYHFKVFQNSKKFLPANVLESSLEIIPMSRNEDTKKRKRGPTFAVEKMYESDDKMTWIEFSNFNTALDTDIRYEIRFIPNNISFQAAYKALTKIEEYELKSYFASFDKIVPSKPVDTVCYKKFTWFNKKIESNIEQMLAIKNILNCTAYPFPFCIFGPPGTGKTSCVVECVLQILKLKPNSKILLTAQSNSACNEMGDRLLQYLPIQKLFRLYSSRLKATNPSALSEKLVPSSNLRGSEHKFPTMEELEHFPVIISTLVTVSQLDRACLQNHFDYIFIDECAATTEPEACIPIVELGCDQSEITASVILVGDPKQLPPVISSKFASEKLGLGVSLMERVMLTKRYKDNDPNYIVQLLDNYRSHPAILQFSNVEFYESKLRAKSTSTEIKVGLNWNELPNKNFPVLFHNDEFPSEIEGTSSYNEKHILIVKSYVKKLIANGIGKNKIAAKDIGVVTPYKAQSEKLKLVLPVGVEVGTSEYFQGREKLIMIISTVKSQSNVKFISDPRRLNVCLTRAKALMIIIGNAGTLNKNPLLRRLVQYCKDKDSFINSTFLTFADLERDVEVEKLGFLLSNVKWD